MGIDKNSPDFKKIVNEVRKQIMDELKPEINNTDYITGVFLKLHFQDIEALRSRIDSLEPEDNFRSKKGNTQYHDDKVNQFMKLANETMETNQDKIKELEEKIKELREDPAKLMRLKIDLFKLGEEK